MKTGIILVLIGIIIFIGTCMLGIKNNDTNNCNETINSYKTSVAEKIQSKFELYHGKVVYYTGKALSNVDRPTVFQAYRDSATTAYNIEKALLKVLEEVR